MCVEKWEDKVKQKSGERWREGVGEERMRCVDGSGGRGMEGERRYAQSLQKIPVT